MSKAPLVKSRRAASDLELDRLLDRARLGDPDAWAALVDRLQNMVYAIPRRYRLNEDDAADVFMTSFQALHQNLDRMSNAWAIPRWLTITAARESLRLVRLRQGITTSIALEELIAQEDHDAAEAAVRAEDAHRVRAALAQMALRCRDLLDALYRENPMPYAELAAQLGLPVGAIGPNRARCLERLRKMLEEEDFFG